MNPLFVRAPPLGTQPVYGVPSYGSTRKRAPHHPLVRVGVGPTERVAPIFPRAAFPEAVDLSKTDGREALGERIIVAGTVTDEAGRPASGAMLEIWQANAAGRYHHEGDTHDAPLDPHFRGIGRVFADAEGRYRFTTIKPGAYPWKNHLNAWRPNHIHFSIFGIGIASRLVTQMYFSGDPLLSLDPIYNAIPNEGARARLVAPFDLELTEPSRALGYRFDIVLFGLHATPFEPRS
jgi:protocatechuate 3,4-dioxygenase, beta subunit